MRNSALHVFIVFLNFKAFSYLVFFIRYFDIFHLNMTEARITAQTLQIFIFNHELPTPNVYLSFVHEKSGLELEKHRGFVRITADRKSKTTI